MKEPSASNVGLAALCAHPWTSGFAWPVDRGSTAGNFGTRVHRGAEALVTREPVFPGVFAGLSESERESLVGHVRQAAEFLARIRPDVRTEAAELRLRYDVDAGTTREVPRGERLELANWTAVLDYVATLTDGRLRVVDWKTGRQAATDPAPRNLQLRIEALAAARFYGARHVRASLVYLSEDRYEVDSADFGPWELAEIAAQVRALRASLRQGPTLPVIGPHCTERYCPLRGVCGATVGALAAVQPMERPLLPVIESDEQALYALERIEGAQEALNAVQHAIDEYARRAPIALPDGRKYAWREHESRRVSVDTEAKRAALGRVLGAHGTAAVQSEYSSTIGAIEDAARKVLAERGETRGLSKLVARALDALKEAGGLHVSTWEKPGFIPVSKSKVSHE